MAEAGFRYDVGEFQCIVFSDGAMVNPENKDVTYANCLFINSGAHRILVDTGTGPGFQPTTGHLPENLAAAGIKRSDIDIVIITHGHIDHVGGIFDAKGGHAFPEARFVTAESEWEYWQAPPDGDELNNKLFDFVRKRLLPARDKFDLVRSDAEVLPGIRFVPAPGHTPGNVMVDICSQGSRLLCIGDIMHSPLEFTDPEHFTKYDVSPEQALRTRARILSDIAESGLLVYAGHFPFPGLGYIRQEKNTMTWQPI